MKPIVRCLALCATLLVVSAQAQTAEQFSRNAGVFAARAAYPMVVIRETDARGQWVMLQARMSGSKWNIRRVDPALPPLVATASFDMFSGISAPQATKPDAEAIADLVLSTAERIELEYLQTPTGWAFSKGRSTSRGQTTAVVPPPPGVFSPAGWAIDGFSVK